MNNFAAAENTVRNTFNVPTFRLEGLKTSIAKLQKKASKLGCGAITLAETGVVVEKEIKDGKGKGTGEFIRFVEVIVEGPKPRINGWTFVAVLEHVDEECVVRSTPAGQNDETALPVRFRAADPRNCDHCKTIRNRSESFVLRNDAGVFMQVGRQCLKDFLGYNDSPEAIATMAELLWEACETAQNDDGEGGGFGGGGSFLSIANFLSFVAASIRVKGWLSRGAARQMDRAATADLAVGVMLAKPDTQAHSDAKKDGLFPTESDRAEAELALQWARDTFVAKPRDQRDDFEHNMAVVAKHESVNFKGLGIAAFIVAGFQKEQARLKEQEILKAQAGTSTHFGEVGKRVDFYAKVLKVTTIPGDLYGPKFLHKLLTREGNVVTWFCSGSRPSHEQDANGQDIAIEAGDKEYLVSATVKAHGEFNKVLETTVSRLAFWTDAGRAEHEEKLAKKAAREAKKAAKAPKA